MAATRPEPPKSCSHCPRLADFLDQQRQTEPSWWNAPVPSFEPVGGAAATRLLIVGLAPGLKGANRTGSPFTGDYAGELLYATLHEFGFSSGQFDARADDGLKLNDCMITNAVRCVPPQNKPTTAEINNCRPFLIARMASLANLQAVALLGRIAHDTTLRTLGARLKDHPFGHGAIHRLHTRDALPLAEFDGLTLFDSYHCSRYNTNTGRLTNDMFRSVFRSIREHIGPAD